ncbi:MAG: amidase [Acidobacteriota bacterium]
MSEELCYQSAIEQRRLVGQREISAVELLEAHLERIEEVNGRVNAICTLAPEKARSSAQVVDERIARGEDPGLLAGLPVAVKDLAMTAGIRTTLGSPIYADFVPSQDAAIVERMKAAGAVVLGKSNTPEFGAGSHTFNEVFGVTRNPYDLGRTAGGSSGGGAAALAAGMVPLADGSDLGGSVRNPPGYNNVVGLRPSPGRVSSWPARQPWDTLPSLGPMARSVEDAALLLAVLAGHDPRDPLSLPGDGSEFLQPLDVDLKGARVAWSPDLGQLPVEPEVLEVLQPAVGVLQELGCVVEEAHPDLRGGRELFQTLRAAAFAGGMGADYERHADQMKETVRWNIERGLALSASDVVQAQTERAALFQRTLRFFETYDYLVLPVSQVPPFPVETEWPREVAGVDCPTYVDWMMSCCLISLTEHPAASVPGGFTADGLPVGLQIVGRHRDELSVLRLARAFEEATGHGLVRPSL